MPVFGKRDAHPEEKSPGEWVTEADKACENFLVPALQALIPNAAVVGEEAASESPRLLERIDETNDVWLVDPLDGTVNFASGKTPFALMVALIRKGETTCSWIFDPNANELSVSEKGSGSWINGKQITVAQDARPLASMNGAVLRRFLPSDLDIHISHVESRFNQVSPGSKCAGFDYPAIAKRTIDFALYWRTLPWDHAAGVLILEEAGGHVARPDGTPFRVADHARSGLLVAHNKPMWQEIRSALFTAYS